MALYDQDYAGWRYRARHASVTLALGIIAALIIFFAAISMKAQQHEALTNDSSKQPTVTTEPSATPTPQ